MSAPAGWYPDTTNPKPNIMRYWDGSAWTEHTHDASAEAQPTEATEAGPAQEQAREPAPSEAAKHVADKADGELKIGLFGGKKAAQQLAHENAELKRVIDKYGIDDAVERESRLAELTAEVAHRSGERDDLKAEMSRLVGELVEVRGTVEEQTVGLFNYENPAESSTELAEQLQALRVKIKAMNRYGQAIRADANFIFNNSEAKGRKFVSDMSKIMLRAYNAEAENCVKTVKAGNLATAEKRLSKVVEQVARQGTMIALEIDRTYHSLRLKELGLASKHLQRLADEKDAEREQRARLREEKRVEQELKREQEKLEKERAHILNAIAALEANGDLEGVARQRIALEDTEKAIADVDYRAANIRAGYVYVISNIGAFGRTMVKIGMTRRLEPMDRIKELSDASVPFHFDVHALFFSADAVAVETMLHQTFAEVRVNKVNLRREFFNTTPDAVLEVLQAHEVELVEYTLEPSAEEFHISWPDAS